MELSTFIRKNEDRIIAEWEAFARSVPIAEQMNREALRDHVVALLRFIADDLETFQTEWQQSEKSKGRGLDAAENTDSAGESHAEQRFIGGFDTVEMISEFRALRASVIKLWDIDTTKTEANFKSLIRFNEAVDQIMTESVVRYTEKINDARSLFLGTLMHDLRNPLNAVSQSAELLLSIGHLDNKQTQLVSQIKTSTERVARLVSELIDEVRIRLGKGLPISPAPMNIEETAHQAVREIRAAYPNCTISLVTTGVLEGVWDSVRISQVLSNLIGNAIQHGDPEQTIYLQAKGMPDGVELSVQNKGDPIPPDVLPKIFDPLTRGKGKDRDEFKTNSLGLGLFITKGIIESHGGSISVVSNATDGTTFTAWLPRVAEANHHQE
ncbi:MAG: ATP-binding protein [Micavibrio sp.]